MKSLVAVVVLLVLSAFAAAQQSVPMKIILTQEDGTPLRLTGPDALQIHVQLQDESGATVKEGVPNGEGQVNFQVIGTVLARGGVPRAVTYRLLVNGGGYEEVMVDGLLPARGDAMVTVALKKRGEATVKAGTTVSLGRLKAPDKAAKEVDRGNEALLKNDLAAAAEHFRKALELYPDYDLAYNNLGVVLMQQGDVEGGRRNFEKAIQLNGHFSRAYTNLGKLALQENKFDAANDYLRKSLASDPLNPETLLYAAEAAVLLGHYQEAAAAVRTLHTVPHEKYALGHFVAARALEQDHKPAEAMQEYALFLKEAPNSPQAPKARAALAALGGKP